ncbi:MAG: GumC family protein [Allorhizobium sp.]
MDIDIFQLPGILRRRLHYIVLAVAVCVALAFAYVLQMTSIYSASSQLLLDPQGLLVDSGSSNSTDSYQPQEQSSLDSQVYIVLSNSILDEVVRKLDLQRDPYFVKPSKDTSAKSEGTLVAAAAALKASLKVERVGQSFIMTITAEHPIAQKAGEIANTVAAVYLQQVDDARAYAAKRASDAFQIQASELRDRMLKAELAVEKFKSDNNLVSTGEKGLVIDQQLAGLNEQLIEARGLEEQQQTKYEQAQRLTLEAIQAGAIPEVLQSTAIGSLRDRYSQLLDRQTLLETSLGANHPQLVAIRSQVANMQRILNQELNGARQALNSNYQRAVANTKALTARLDSLSTTSFTSGAAQIKMRQLESEAEAVRAIYKTFLDRVEELGQQKTVNVNNSRVINTATAQTKSLGKVKLLILAAASFFGVAFGSGLAVLRELVSPPQISEAELLRRTGLVLLSRIPTPGTNTSTSRPSLLARLRPKKPEITDEQREFSLAVLKTARLLLDGVEDEGPVMLVFVSAGPALQSGLVVSGIAHSLIDIGKDVLFAPGDLRTDIGADQSRSSGQSLTGTQQLHDEESEPLADVLKYESLSPLPRQAPTTARPTYSHYLNRNTRAAADIVIVNACGTAAMQYLPILVERCTALVVVSQSGKATAADLAEFSQATDAGRHKMLGLIAIGA